MQPATQSSKVLYTAKVHTAGNRDGGVSISDDRRLDIRHSLPGTPGSGTNPEQLLAAGWSACFQGAIRIAAHQAKVAIPAGTFIDAEIDLVSTDGSYSLSARLNVDVPGLSREVVQELVNAAHETCPYSKALSGNIPITFNIV